MDHKIPQIHQQQLLFNDLDGTFILMLIACLNQNQSQQLITLHFTLFTLIQTHALGGYMYFALFTLPQTYALGGYLNFCCLRTE